MRARQCSGCNHLSDLGELATVRYYCKLNGDNTPIIRIRECNLANEGRGGYDHRKEPAFRLRAEGETEVLMRTSEIEKMRQMTTALVLPNTSTSSHEKYKELWELRCEFCQTYLEDESLMCRCSQGRIGNCSECGLSEFLAFVKEQLEVE